MLPGRSDRPLPSPPLLFGLLQKNLSYDTAWVELMEAKLRAIEAQVEWQAYSPGHVQALQQVHGLIHDQMEQAQERLAQVGHKGGGGAERAVLWRGTAALACGPVDRVLIWFVSLALLVACCPGVIEARGLPGAGA